MTGFRERRLRSLVWYRWLHYLYRAADLHTCALRRKNPVLVYQMGKVGSTAIVNAINQQMRQFRAFQVHRLSPERTEEIQRRYFSGERYYMDMLFERHVYKWITARVKDTKIITCARNPVTHAYSSFFQNIARSTRGSVTPEKATVDNLASHFLSWDELDIAIRWFDLEPTQVVQSSVCAMGFDRSVGWQRYKLKKYDVLVIKSEVSDTDKEAAISKFLDSEPIELTRENESKKKQYASLFREFTRTVRIPPDVIEEWKASEYVRTFYSPKEIDDALALMVNRPKE